MQKLIPSLSSSRKTDPSTMEELLAQTGYQLATYKRGDVIEAKVISVSPKRLLLDTGGKSEAIVHEKEAPFIADILKSLKKGDKVTAHVVNPENDRGQMVVSLRRTAVTKRWELLTERMKQNAPVEVIIKGLSRGGFLVDYQGLRGFIPLSQVDTEFSRLGDRATGRKVEVKIIELDRGSNRLVFSQSSPTASANQQRQLLQQVKVGQVCPAEITGIVPFGAFVSVKVADEGSLPGLIHISEIAWEKVDSPNDYLVNGQKVEVKVIKIDEKTNKLTLSLKQMTKDPWLDVPKMFTPDQVVKGKVVRVSNYGIFVSLLPGIEGLIHISKLAPGEEPKAGDEVECIVENINPDERKISLSLITKAKPIGYR